MSFAGKTTIFLLAIRGGPIFDQLFTLAVAAKYSVRDHENILHLATTLDINVIR